MKKILLCTLLLCFLCVPALGDTERVVDDAHLFSAGEETLLQDQIDAIRSAYDMDVAIVTKNSIGYRSPGLYAADFYDEMGYGMGPGKDGLIFLISMAERDYFTATHGKAITIFTDYGLDSIHDHMVSDLSRGFYYDAMETYLSDVAQFLADYQETGVPYDIGNSHSLESPINRMLAVAPLIFFVALAIGLIVAFSLKSQLKTVRKKQNATSYVVEDSFHLSRSQDIYLYTTTVRRKIETDSGSSRGGSSTFRSSGGGSFGGRGGKF